MWGLLKMYADNLTKLYEYRVDAYEQATNLAYENKSEQSLARIHKMDLISGNDWKQVRENRRLI